MCKLGTHRMFTLGVAWPDFCSALTRTFCMSSTRLLPMKCAAGMQAIWMVDTKGLITMSRGDELPAHKKFFARQDGPNIKVTRLRSAVVAAHLN